VVVAGTADPDFPIDLVLARVAEAVAPYPPAALYELAERGYGSPFEQLAACILSIRTRDEAMLPAALRLFELGRTAEEIARASPEQIDERIATATFHERKARQIHDIARLVVAEHGGSLPCDEAVLLALHGVGPKCANLVLGIACGQARIGVDVHVHRITNRWGYVKTRSPEETMTVLEAVLPQRYRVEINRVLVPFGKHICTGRLPHCSTCPVLAECAQVGVTAHR
jgi:endonuclease-3